MLNVSLFIFVSIYKIYINERLDMIKKSFKLRLLKKYITDRETYAQTTM